MNTIEIQQRLNVACEERNFNAVMEILATIGKARHSKEPVDDSLLTCSRICSIWTAKCYDAIQQIASALQDVISDPSEMTLDVLKKKKEEACGLFQWESIDPNIYRNVDTVIAMTEDMMKEGE